MPMGTDSVALAKSFAALQNNSVASLAIILAFTSVDDLTSVVVKSDSIVSARPLGSILSTGSPPV
jgi:hypothetical protein